MPSKTLEELFWPQVEIGPECWNWTGKLDKYGYGYLRIPGGPVRHAHVIAWILLKGPAQDGLILHHDCRNRKCVNPDHTEWLTQSAHASLRMIRDRCSHGHLFTPENTYTRPGGYRRCRKCCLEENKRWRQQNPDKYAEYVRKARLAKKSHQFSTPAEVV